MQSLRYTKQCKEKDSFNSWRKVDAPFGPVRLKNISFFLTVDSSIHIILINKILFCVNCVITTSLNKQKISGSRRGILVIWILLGEKSRKMINYSDYTLKQFCCSFDLKTGTIIIAASHFILLNSILYSWEQFTGEKIFWTIIQAISTVVLIYGVVKVMHTDIFITGGGLYLKICFRTIICCTCRGLLWYFHQRLQF